MLAQIKEIERRTLAALARVETTARRSRRRAAVAESLALLALLVAAAALLLAGRTDAIVNGLPAAP